MAGKLGMTVKQLLESMDSIEISEWMALTSLENKEAEQAKLDAKAKSLEEKARKNRGNR